MDTQDEGGSRYEAAPQASADLAVRQAAAADSPAIVDLAAELGYPVESDTIRRRLTTLPAGHVVFVATNQDRVVGWLHAFHGHSLLHGDRVQIAGLVVASDQQGRGVGGFSSPTSNAGLSTVASPLSSCSPALNGMRPTSSTAIAVSS